MTAATQQTLRDAVAEDDSFARELRDAYAKGEAESYARILSDRLRQMDKRAKAANARADAAEAALARLTAERDGMERALKAARQSVINSVESYRPWVEKIPGRINPWQPTLDAVEAALRQKDADQS